jgi:hypothetical protein
MEHEEKLSKINELLEPAQKGFTCDIRQLLMKAYELGRADAFAEMDGLATAINELKKTEGK